MVTYSLKKHMHANTYINVAMATNKLTYGVAMKKKLTLKYVVKYINTLRKCITMEILGGITVFNFNKGKNIAIIRRIKYSENDDLYLNIYQPRERTSEKLTVILYLHGGGWISGSPEGREAFTTQLASAGYFVVSLFYGHSPKYCHPLPIIHAYQAIAWLTKRREKFNVDTSSIVVAGESAGAHLSAIIGAISSNPLYKKRFNLSAEVKDIKVSALILNCGIYEIANVLESGFNNISTFVASYYGKPLKYLELDKMEVEMSPIYWITRDFPRSFLISAENDDLVQSTLDFKKVLEENLVEFTHYHGQGILAVHAFAVAQGLKISKEVMEEIKKFLFNVKSLSNSQ